MITEDELFAPPHEHWNRVSPRLIKVRRISALLTWTLVWVIPAACLLIFFLRWWWIAAIVAAVGIGVTIWRVRRQKAIVTAIGYCERDTDLYLRDGLWIRRLVVVPYGRMQVVEVSAGPILRHFNLASVELTTASPTTNAVIPGLERKDAELLRDRLAERGENQAAGL